MSASSKKKLRKEQEAAKMTEKQLAAQAEAKKTNLYTTLFVVTMVAILVIAVTVGVSQFISNSGIREKNTTALTVGSHELSNADLNYYYIDTINTFYSQNGSYASLFGLDTAKPLNEQFFDESTGETWADYFLESAKSNAASVIAVSDAARAAGFTLPEEDAVNIDNTIANFQLYATLYGYTDTETYLKAMYGKGATEDGLRNYLEQSLLAEAYSVAYQDSLTYDDAALRAAEAENFHKYSSFNYNYYYLAASRFQEGGTENEDGTTTYSAEEKAAAIAAAEEAANGIVAGEIASVADLDAAIAALSINAESTTAKSTSCENYSYGSMDAELAAWMTAEGRVAGELGVIANKSTTDGVEETLGYYVAMFHSVDDNTGAMKDARHILAAFEGGTTDESGATVYSDEEKAAAKTAAEEILAQWQAGAATEDSFAALASEQSDDTGSIETGGLYQEIYPGQMVEPFENWCYDPARQTGDTGIVETDYGYHVMYFVGDSARNYRDYLIAQELASADYTEWYNGIVNAASVTDGNTQYITMDLVLGG